MSILTPSSISPEEKQRYFSKADFFKFYLTIGVLLTHSLNYEIYDLSNRPGLAAGAVNGLEILWLYLSGLLMPSFFLISAFSFMLDYQPQKALQKLQRRLYTLFIPWLLWNTIMWLLSIAMEHIPVIAARLNSGFGFELSLRSWFVDGLLLPANGPFWFLSNLMVVLLLAPLLYPVLKRKILCLTLLMVEFAAVFWIGSSPYHVHASRYSVLMSLLFFTEAAFLAVHYPAFAGKRYSNRARLISLGILILYLFLGSNSATQNGGIRHALVFTFACPALWIAVGDVSLGKKEKAADTYRFWIYAAHYLPLECVEKVWLILIGNSVISALLSWILSPVLTVLLLIAGGAVVRKLCFPLWCVLTGSRIRPKEKANTLSA